MEGGFQIEKIWNSYSVNIKAKVGPNNGEKFSVNEKVYIKKSKVENFLEKKLNDKEKQNLINQSVNELGSALKN